MLLDVIYSICFNICLLVVLAFMMTKMDFVQRLLLNEEGGSEEGRGESVWQRLLEKVLLGVIFGVFCIISDYIGIQVTGALPNARVIGVLSAGFLGGPVSGFITTVIAAAHRYLIFPERISTVACVLSAIIHGIIGSFIGWKKKENRQYSNTFLLGVTFISEMIHIVLILLLTRPFDAAVEIVKIVIVPMVIIMSMYGALEGCVKSGNFNLLLIIWLTNIPKNFIMALPFQLLVAGPLVRRVFRGAFPEGTVLA